MKLGIVGLGRMGGNMTKRLRRAGFDVAAHDRDSEVTRRIAGETGAEPADSLGDLVHRLSPPRVVWLMVPAGTATGQAIAELAPLLSPGDVIVDGANSHYLDSEKRARKLEAHGVSLVDAGVSGGIWGLDEGYALMVGGNAEAVARIEPILAALAPAPDRGWLHCGPSGSGHFVKMIHNGIEYGMMQAYAEGFALLEARTEYRLDLAAIAEMWRHGSVVRSWLLDLIAGILDDDAKLPNVAPYVADSGEGRWAAQEAIEQGIPAPVLSLALAMRFASQGKDAYGAKLLAKMREAFGGHSVKTRAAAEPIDGG